MKDRYYKFLKNAVRCKKFLYFLWYGALNLVGFICISCSDFPVCACLKCKFIFELDEY